MFRSSHCFKRLALSLPRISNIQLFCSDWPFAYWHCFRLSLPLYHLLYRLINNWSISPSHQGRCCLCCTTLIVFELQTLLRELVASLHSASHLISSRLWLSLTRRSTQLFTAVPRAHMICKPTTVTLGMPLGRTGYAPSPSFSLPRYSPAACTMCCVHERNKHSKSHYGLECANLACIRPFVIFERLNLLLCMQLCMQTFLLNAISCLSRFG